LGRATACALLAKFEQCFRAGLAASFLVERALDRVAESHDTAALVGLTLGKATLANLGTVGRAAAADHLTTSGRRLLHSIRPCPEPGARRRGCRSRLRRALLDFKATGSTQILVCRVRWQLLGGALAGTTDAYAIKALGVSALRWRRRIIWPLDELTAEADDRARAEPRRPAL
jgi:hypothetical protein